MKITRLQIGIIGAVLALVFGLGIYFLLIQPVLVKTAEDQANYEKRQAVANQRGSARQDLEEAKKKVKLAEADWDVYVQRFMPNINVSSTYDAWQQLVNEQVRVLGPELDRFVQSDKTVRVMQANFALPAPPDDPNQAVSEFFVFNPGSVQVAGTFRNVLRNAERWNQFKRLALVTGLQLTGNSPNLVGQYTVTVFEFTRGDKAKAVTIPQAAGGAGGGGGRFGGMMPGMGGGGMMMPGMGSGSMMPPAAGGGRGGK